MFTHPLTPMDEYWIGYFRADGNIHRRGKHKSASFGQTRFHPVSEFAKHVGREGRVASRARVTNYNFCVVHTTSSAKAGYALDDLGAKTDLWPSLYESADFWRGMIDGDGCLIHQNGRPGLFTIIFQLIATLDDNTAFRSFLESRLKCPVVVEIHNRSKGMSVIRLSGNKAIFATKLLYLDKYTANIKKNLVAQRIMSTPYVTKTNAWKPPC